VSRTEGPDLPHALVTRPIEPVRVVEQHKTTGSCALRRRTKRCKKAASRVPTLCEESSDAGRIAYTEDLEDQRNRVLETRVEGPELLRDAPPNWLCPFDLVEREVALQELADRQPRHRGAVRRAMDFVTPRSHARGSAG